MRYAAILLLLFASTAYADLTTNLVAYWTLDEASGTRTDAHSTNDLTDNNTVLAAAGKINNGADFELDTTESLSHTDSTDFSMGAEVSFTISLWFKPESLSGNTAIAGQWDWGGTTSSYLIWSAGGGLRFSVSPDGSALTTVNGPTLSTGTWYHIVAIHNATTNELRLIVNNGTPATAAHTTGAFDSGKAFVLCAADSPTVFTVFSDGVIDEAGLWKRALSDAEASQLYNGGNARAYPLTVAATGSFPQTITY